MAKKSLVVGGSLLVLVCLGLCAVGTVLAEEPTAAPGGLDRAWGFGLRGRSWGPYDAQAEVLGLTPEELLAELYGGKTLADVAEARGVDLGTIQETMKAAWVEAMAEAIEEAVEDGRLSQDQADWLLEGQRQGFMPGGQRFGWPMGRRLGGRTLHQRATAAPTAS